jgi:2,4-dichlorophenol 6-monooxygenase
VHTIGARDGLVDCYGDWARLRETDTSGAVLVRPDRHVAWRSDRYTGAAARDLTAVLRRMLTAIG